MSECPFCKIVAGQAPCWRVYEDNRVLAFLDIAPVTDGHTLIIPKAHYVNIYDIPEELIAHIAVVSKRLAQLYRHALGAEAMNFLHSAGRAAHQEVFHYHLHLIPRQPADGLHLGYRPRSGRRDFATVLELIQAASNGI